MIKIYLDTSVWCRPFDEKTEDIIRDEEALLEILRKATKREVEIISSVVIDYEISKISDTIKRDDASSTITLFESKKILEIPVSIRDEIIKLGLKPMDATHLAIAIQNSEYFISVDEEILNRRGKIEEKHRIRIRSPIEFVMEVK